VLAVVSGGLLLSSKRQSMLNYKSRIEGINVWTNLVFVMNGLIFLLIGLQLPSISQQLGDITLGRAIAYGLAVTFILIVTRFICTFGAAAFTMFMKNFVTVADPNPGWKAPLIAGWAGMRGVVSLAAALSIPLFIQEGEAFPYRNLILFITFIVILVTLVLQGLTLPWLIRIVKPEDKDSIIPEERQEIIVQKKLALTSLGYLEEKYKDEISGNDHLRNLHEKLKFELEHFKREFDGTGNENGHKFKNYRRIYLDVLDHQRKLLNEMNRRAEFDEEIIRKYLSLIDMEELEVREK